MKPPWQCLIILLISVLLLQSCRSDNISNLDTEQIPLKGDIIEWIEIPDGLTKTQSAQLQTIITDSVQDFMKLNPDVNVIMEFVSSDETFSKFRKQISRGAGPNLFAVSLAKEKLPLLIRTGYLKRLDEDNVDLSKFRPETLKQLRYQGHLYALPVNLTTQVFCYNKNKVKEIPKTLNELIIQARKGYSVGLHSNFRDSFWGIGTFGSQTFDKSGRIVFTQQTGWIEWMQWLKQARNEPNFFLIEDAEILQKSFVEEKLSYMTCSSEWLPNLREALGNQKLGIALLPGQKDRSATPALWTVGFIFNRASSANQHQLALKLAQFLSNAQSQKKVQLEVPFLIPVNKDVTVDFRLFPMQAILVEQSKTGITFSLDQLDENQSFLQNGDSIYHKVLGGEITAEEAVFQLNQAVN